MTQVDFYFDCSSPWTYLAWNRIHGVLARTGADVTWKPILVGGVFNAVNEELYEMRANPNPVKARYSTQDLQLWARHCGITIGWPDVFPVRAVDPMRGAFVALVQGKMVEYATELFEAYWGRNEDIGQHDVLRAICEKVGIEPKSFFEAIATDELKARLKDTTQELIDRGGFGSPTMYVNGMMFFGNDRLPLVEAALRGDL